MLDYKNENWCLYKLGIIICSVGLIIVIFIRYFNRKNLDSDSDFILMNIQHIMVTIYLSLHGTREVFAKNEKTGYLAYFASLFIFITLMVINFLD